MQSFLGVVGRTCSSLIECGLIRLNTTVSHSVFWKHVRSSTRHQHMPLVCQVLGISGLCERGCTSDEITTFLNVLLKSESRATSHSLKHTTLSWSSSYSIDEQSRTLLGHHSLPGSKALMVYSRDMLTGPLHLYCSMLVNIFTNH